MSRGTVWTVAQVRGFLATARQHRLFVSSTKPPPPERGPATAQPPWTDIDLDARKITITGSTVVRT